MTSEYIELFNLPDSVLNNDVLSHIYSFDYDMMLDILMAYFFDKSIHKDSQPRTLKLLKRVFGDKLNTIVEIIEKHGLDKILNVYDFFPNVIEQLDYYYRDMDEGFNIMIKDHPEETSLYYMFLNGIKRYIRQGKYLHLLSKDNLVEYTETFFTNNVDKLVEVSYECKSKGCYLCTFPVFYLERDDFLECIKVLGVENIDKLVNVIGRIPVLSLIWGYEKNRNKYKDTIYRDPNYGLKYLGKLAIDITMKLNNYSLLLPSDISSKDLWFSPFELLTNVGDDDKLLKSDFLFLLNLVNSPYYTEEIKEYVEIKLGYLLDVFHLNADEFSQEAGNIIKQVFKEKFNVDIPGEYICLKIQEDRDVYVYGVVELLKNSSNKSNSSNIKYKENAGDNINIINAISSTPGSKDEIKKYIQDNKYYDDEFKYKLEYLLRLIE